MKFKTSETLSTIKAYEAGKPLAEVEREYKINHIIKLASNENPLGFSQKIYDAVNAHMKDMNRYPESSGYLLKNKLSQKFMVSPDHIVLGNGSDDIIALLCHGFLNPGDEALMPLPSFLMYEISVRTAKGRPVMVPLVDFSTNLKGITEAISPKTRMIFITNPFNPTGSTISSQEFNQFLTQVPDDVIIILDEAYIEFVRDESVYDSLQNPLADPRIVTLRTFSKVYGLAGFRVGYGIMDSEIAEILNRIRQPFNVNTLAQVAAIAALEDEAFVEKTVNIVHEGLDYLFAELDAVGLRCLPTQSNFLMVDLKTDATQVFKEMLKFGVIVRSMKSYGFDTFLRITAGTREENKILMDTLKKVIKK